MNQISGKRWVSTALILAAVVTLIWAICQPRHRGGFGNKFSSEFSHHG